MTTFKGSTHSVALAVLLLAAAHAGAEEQPSSSSQSHHTRHHHSHHRNKSKAQPAADPTENSKAQPAVEPAQAETATPTVVETKQPEPVRAETTTPAEPPKKAPSRGVSTQAQSVLQHSQSADRPWVKGVSPAEQAAALELFREGNGLLKESLFVQSAAKYREALRHCDHPGIHYNLALALLNLDQPVDVYTHLQEALKYGALPLDNDKYDHATHYRTLIEKQLARLDVECQREGALVSVDGQRAFTAPGHYEALVRAGQHTIVGEKAGYVTAQNSPTLPAGQKTTIELNLYTVDDLTHYKRRFPNWLPYTVLGGGILIAGIGGVLYWQAHESIRSYDAGIAQCSTANQNLGCMPSGALASKRSMGQSMQASAFAMWGIGGAVLVSGVTLLSMNRARPYQVDPEHDKLSLVPVLGSGSVGLSASLQF
jgi:hypothetical protein